MVKQNVGWGFRILALLIFSCFGIHLYAQVKVTGKVISGIDEMPLVGVTVVEKGTGGAAGITDLDGNFSLNLSDANKTLVFSYIGFQKQEVALKGRMRINVTLKEDAAFLDEVIVVGYGSQRKINLTGAVAQIDNAELKTAPNGSLSSMIQGRLPGLISKQSSGQPGADGANLYIRGNNAPLIIVDGVARDFPSIGPDEVESITILKDASAAIYGVRAANGVILVTTKKGRKKKPTIALNSAVSLATKTAFPKFLNGPGYAYWYNKAQEMDGVPEENRLFTPKEMDRIINGDPEEFYGNTDWFSLLLKSAAPSYTNTVSLSGGNDDFNYFVSIGAYNQTGIMSRTGYDRYNVRANLEGKVSENFTMNLQLSASEGESYEPGVSAGNGNATGSIFNAAMLAAPYLPAFTKDGDYLALETPHNGANNPLVNRDKSGKTTGKATMLFTNLGFTWDMPFIKGLKVKFNGAYDRHYSMKKTAQTPYEIVVYNQGSRMTKRQLARYANKAVVEQWFNDRTRYMLQPSITYDNSFGKHTVSGLFLYEYIQTLDEGLSAGRKDYPITDIMDLDFGNTVLSDFSKGGHWISRRAGYVTRLNYAYDNRYLFEFTGRLDGTPLLASDKRWGFFPSASVGWRISEEKFFKDKISFIESLKIRASVGRLGNEGSLNYGYMGVASLSKDPVVMMGTELQKNLDSGGIYNPELKWETTTTWNLGIDASMWNGLLGVEVDVFYAKTQDIMSTKSGLYPPSLGGYYYQQINYGKVDNRGLELVLTQYNKIGDFTYNIRGNVSWARNKVLVAVQGANEDEKLRTVGKPMNLKYGFVSEGLFQTQEEIDNSPVYNRNNTKPGDIKFKDLNGDGRITMEQDRQQIGRSNTPEMMFGLNLNGAWKGFDFNVFFQGAALCDVALCGTYSDRGFQDDTFYTRPFFASGNTPYFLVENSWTPENTNAKYPRLGMEVRNVGSPNSDWWILDGSYVRLKNLQIGYTFPKKWMEKVNIEKLRIYASGSNLFTLSHLPYLDPEMPDVNQGYYPQQRVFEFGLNLEF